MIDLYAHLIIEKQRPFSKVPNRYKDEVKARLKELGYDTNGDPINEDTDN